MTFPRRRGAGFIGVVTLCLVGALWAGSTLLSPHVSVGATTIARAPVGMAPSAVVVAGEARRVFVVNAVDTTISVLDETTGAPLAPTTVGSGGGAHPVRIALDARTGHALVLTDDGSLSVLRVQSGRVLHRVLLEGSPSAIAVDEGSARAFVTEADAGAVAIVDTRTGARLRTVLVGPYPEELVVDRRASLVFVANQGDASVSVLDVRTGRLTRTLRLGDTPIGLAIGDHDRMLFIASAHGSVIGVDVATGARRFQRAMSPRLTTTRRLLLAVDDARGTLWVAHDAHIDELDALTGRSLASISLPSTVTAVAVDPITGGALATVRGPLDARGGVLGKGSLLVFDARGQHLDTIGVGVNPSALAVDAGARRVFVVDANLNPDGSAFWPLPEPSPPLAAFLNQLHSWAPFLPSAPPAQVPVRSTSGTVDVLRLDGP